MNPVVVSVSVATVATTLCLVLGMPLAFRLAFGHKSRWIVDLLLAFPLVTPPAVVGWVLLELMGRRGGIGMGYRGLFEHDLLFTWQAILIASVVLGLPLFVRTVVGGLSRIDSELMESARLAGASESAVRRHIVLPLAAPAVASGIVLAFGRSLGEFGAALMVGGQLPGSTETIATALWSAVETDDRAAAWKWALLLAAVSLALHAAMTRWIGSHREGTGA